MRGIKTIICLANSKKNSGRCVAGKEITQGTIGGWIRPVSARDHGELSENDRVFANGRDPRVGDVITVPVSSHQAHPFQPENYVIDDTQYWGLVRRASALELQGCVSPVNGALWSNNSSSYYGYNDRVLESAAPAFDTSLTLISVDDFKVVVRVEGAEFSNGKRKVRGEFSVSGHNYCLMITDPILHREYLAQDDGEYPVGAVLLCISLGEPFADYAYKLIAGVVR